MHKEIKALIFDIDNTLLATDRFVFENLKKTVIDLKNKGLNINLPTDEEIKKVQAQNLPFEEIFQMLFVGKLGEENIWEIVLTEYRVNAPHKTYEATPGALEAVTRAFNNGCVLGLVTNRVRMVEERLAQAGFDVTNFRFISTPSKKEFAKPHPKAFEEALHELEKMGISAEEVVMFGDHPDDYLSSFYQNIKFVGVLQGQITREIFVEHGLENSLIVDSLENIKEVMQRVQKISQYRISLYNTSALDGRHRLMSYPLRHYFSEYALHKHRVMVEIEHLIALSEYSNGQVVRQLSEIEKQTLRKLYQQFSAKDAYAILQYDHLGRNGVGPTEHDVKSCELWIKEKLVELKLSDIAPAVHMFVTSADINNLAYKVMLSSVVKDIILPEVIAITDRLQELTKQYQDSPVMARTHLQPASPTTFGKIFAGYLMRLQHSLDRLLKQKLVGKINGAVGNYNTFVAAYPEIDWKGYSYYLCSRFGFDTDLWTDQRGLHIDMIWMFQEIQAIGNIVRDLAQDLSLYAAFETMYFAKVESHVGSSVMPHKINPWFAEVAEGSIKKANGLINTFVNELDVSRLQRDLSDHEFERSYGEAVGYVLIAIKHMQIALGLIKPDLEYSRQEIIANAQIVTEAIQTILRKHGKSDAYEIIKQEVRGKVTTIHDLEYLVEKLNVSMEVKEELMKHLNPVNYTGLAIQLAEDAIRQYEEFKNKHVSVLS